MSENDQLDGTPFAVVPEWIIDLPISGQALRLYAVLARYVGSNGKAWPSRQTLARRMRCSVDAVDRYKNELLKNGAIAVERRVDDTNVYRLRVAAPLRLPGRESAASVAADMRPERKPLKDIPSPDGEGAHPVEPQDAPLWRSLLDRHMQFVIRDGVLSWDLLDVYAGAWDELTDGRQDPVPTVGDHIALVVDFVERVTGETLEPEDRKKVAMTVRRHGKAALVGWSRALGTTDEDTGRSRLQYALGTIRRVLEEGA